MAKLQDSYNCPLELSMDLIGGKWKLIILWYILEGPKRFGQLNRLIPKITQKVLSTQLRELEEKGLISRKVYATVPPKVEYSLTDYGYSLKSILTEICSWSTSYAENNSIEITNNSIVPKNEI